MPRYELKKWIIFLDSCTETTAEKKHLFQLTETEEKMKKIRLVYRIWVFLSCVLTLVCFSSFAEILIKNKVQKQKKVSALIRLLSKILMRAMGFKVTAKGLKHLQKNKNYLIVANHLSYTDITILHSFIQHNCFITHYEWQENNPFLNLIAKKAGVYFVERRNLKNIRKELRDTTDILKKGLHLVFFPEGTSTDGSKTLPFHPPFFITAIRAKKPVLPIRISYTKIENKEVCANNKDQVYWYGNTMDFMQHLFRMVQLESVEVCVHFLPPISSENKTSRALAEESRSCFD